MSNSRRFESVSGLGAALLGFLALAYALFGPIYQGTSSSGQSTTASILQMGLQPATLVAFEILVLALIGVALSSFFHSRTAAKGWLVVLGVSALAIVALTLLTLPSLGLFLLPSALLVLIAFVLSLFTKSVIAN